MVRHLRHDTLYLEDGDLVIAAYPHGNKDTATMFRVHTPLLKQHSVVFADMCAFPDGGDGQEMYDSAPLVELSDAAEDVQKFLYALYNPGRVMPLFRRSEPDFSSAAFRMMALGGKYQVDSIRKAVLAYMEDQWPKTAFEFSNLISARGRWNGPRIQLAHVCEAFPEPASAIRLAIDNGLPSILPPAFYVLAVSDPEDRWPEGSVFSAPETYALPARWDLLDDKDRLRLYQGRYKLSNKIPNIRGIFHPTTNDYVECKGVWYFGPRESYPIGEGEWYEEAMREKWEVPCNLIGWRYVNDYLDELLRSAKNVRRSDPVYFLLKLDQSLHEVQLCVSCGKLARRKIADMITTIWADLPSIFDLKNL